MKILICMRSLRQSEGGPITAALGLSGSLVANGHSVTLTAHDDGEGEAILRDLDVPEGVRVKLFPLTSRIWEHSRGYARWLKSGVQEYDLVIVNSIWISHVFFACRSARLKHVPYIVRPHGCLTQSDLQHHRFRKRLYLRLIEGRNLHGALYVHATSQAEAEDLKACGVANAEVIPLGVDNDLLTVEAPNRQRNRVLFLGRVAEKKGVDILIRALAHIAGADLHLDVVGVDHRDLQTGLESLADELQVRNRVTFHGHANAKERMSFLTGAGVFALASKDENFGLSTAEAMATGLPVVITRDVSHADLVRATASGIVADREPAAFAIAMKTIAALDQNAYGTMSDAAREAVTMNYSWAGTAESVVGLAVRRIAGHA